MRRAVAIVAVTLCALSAVALTEAQQQDQTAQQTPPPVFRTGINYVRVDVIATGRNGASVADLKQSDFEITEDGKPQTIENFKFIKLDGGIAQQLSEEKPRAIHTDDDEQQEAARDDTRLFAIFLDDYHVRKENSLRLRAPLEQFVQTQLGPSDMIGLMYPLESVLNVRMTRDKDQVARGLAKFLGRKFDYTPENEIERQYAYLPAETQEQIRVRVTLSAIQGLIVHMGTLKEGRKQLIVVSEGWSNQLPAVVAAQNPTVQGGGVPLGPGGNGVIDPIGAAGLTGSQVDFAARMDMEQLLRDVYDEANKNNVALYMVDPRGLAVSEFDVSDGNVDPQTDRAYFNETQDTLRALAVNTDGRAIINRNDLAGGMKQVVSDVSAYYLIGYNSSQTPSDGKFHEIKVRVKRPGVQVRARKGYWALTHEEVALSTTAPKPAAPAPVVQALNNIATTAASSRARAIRTWLGTSRGDNGKTRVTFVWEPMPRAPGSPPLADSQQPARVAVTAVGDSGNPYFRGRVPDVALASNSPSSSAAAGGGSAARGPQRVVFDAPPGKMELRLSVEGATAGVIDSELREVDVPDLTKTQTTLSTPTVFRARTPRELQQMKADPQAIPATLREFSRTDRVFVRVQSYGAGGPKVEAHLLNRAGQSMQQLPVTSGGAASADSTIDLPLASIAPGEYVLELKAAGDSGEAKEYVGFRVTS